MRACTWFTAAAFGRAHGITDPAEATRQFVVWRQAYSKQRTDELRSRRRCIRCEDQPPARKSRHCEACQTHVAHARLQRKRQSFKLPAPDARPLVVGRSSPPMKQLLPSVYLQPSGAVALGLFYGWKR